MKRALAVASVLFTLVLSTLPLRAEDEKLPRGAIARLGSRRLHHADEVLSLGFTPDSKRLVSTSHDGSLRTWDAASGAPLGRFPVRRRDEAIASVGTRAACLVPESLEGDVRFVDVATGAEVATVKLELPTGEKKLASAAIDREGVVVATASRDDDELAVWDGKKLLVEQPLALAHQLVLSPDGRKIAAVTFDAVVLFTRDGKLLESVAFERLASCAFSADGARLALVGKAASAVTLVDLATGTRTALESRGAHPTCVAFAPDGSVVAAGDRDGTIRLFDAKTAKERDLGRHHGRVLHALVAPDGDAIVTADEDALHFWHGEEHREIPVPGGVRGACFAASGALYVACGDALVRVVDPATLEVKRVSEVATTHPPLEAIACAASGSRFVTVSGATSGGVRFWNSIDRSLESPHRSGVTSVAIVGTTIFTGGTDKIVRAWEWKGRDAFAEVEHDRAIEALAASPDGERLATLTAERVVRLFSVATRRLERKLDAKGATCMAFAPDSKRLALGFADGTVRILDAATGKERLVLAGHEGGVTAVGWSPDGERLVSGGRDFTALVWRVGS